jgi:hypothetical protein
MPRPSSGEGPRSQMPYPTPSWMALHQIPQIKPNGGPLWQVSLSTQARFKPCSATSPLFLKPHADAARARDGGAGD